MDWLYQKLEDLLGLYKNEFEVIFDKMYDEGIYNFIGVTSILVPLGLLVLFYYAYRNPYAKVFPHWSVILGGAAILVCIITYFKITNGLAEFLVDDDQATQDYARKLIYWYTGINAFLTIIFGFIFSLGLKTKSKMYTHLPF